VKSDIRIGASLLSADMADLAGSIGSIEDAVDYIHCDVMDGHFVPNLTFGPPVIKAIKRVSAVPLDVHLMIERPGAWIERFLGAGLGRGDYLTFHIEAEPDPSEAIGVIRAAGVGAGLSIKPGTPFGAIEPWLDRVDQVLVMTVEPGFGGQAFIAEMLPRIAETKARLVGECLLAVDGGIDGRTAPLAAKQGARLLVAGKAIYGERDPKSAAEELRRAATIALQDDMP